MKYAQKTAYGLLLFVITVMTSASDLRAGEGNLEKNTIKTASTSDQLWMQENLDGSRYRNGDAVLYAALNQDWLEAAAKGKGMWCFCHNDAASNGTYHDLSNV